MEINAVAQLKILEACRHYNPDIKLVFASTRQIYGKPISIPVDESHPLRPVDVNGINKMAGEQYHLVYNQVYGIRSSILRLTNTYGPRMRVKDARQTFLGIWIRRIIEGKPSPFRRWSQLRDFNYVDDVVDALMLAAASEKTNGQIYNLGAADTLSLTDTAKLLVDLNQSGMYEYIPFPENRKVIDIGDYSGNYDKIKQELGWQPRISLEEGLKRTLSFYQTNYPHYW